MGCGYLYGVSCSAQLLANGHPEMTIWREIGGLRGGPSRTAAPEQTKCGYEIARHLGGFVTRVGAARWGGGVPQGG